MALSPIKIHRITGPLTKVRYWKGKAYTLISWEEDEASALKIARGLLARNHVEVVLNNTTYGVYIKSFKEE